MSDDKTLRIWDMESKQYRMLRGKALDKPARSCEYADSGGVIAVGFKDGTFSVFKTETLDLVENVAHRSREISDLKFSPGKLIIKINFI